MPISYTYNTVFIHIPKCAGTTIEKILGTSTTKEYFCKVRDFKNEKIKTPQHFTYMELTDDLNISWLDFFVFSVVRNPYSRLVSEYNYRKDISLTKQCPQLDPINFETFVQSLNMEPLARIKFFDGHLETQSSFLRNKSGVIEQSIKIFRFENLTPCWAILEEKTDIKYSDDVWSRKSIDNTPYQTFYTPVIKSAVYNFYKEDFDNFGYDPEL